MRKIICLALTGAVLGSALGLAACERHSCARSHYTITGEYFPETRTLAAEMTVEVPNMSEVELSELKFQLWANAYREGAAHAPVSENFSSLAYYAGEDHGEIEIKGVAGAESFSVCGEDDNILSLKLAAPLSPGDCATVTVKYEVELARINHRLGVTASTVNLANFYPILCEMTGEGFREYIYTSSGDPFVSEIADYDVTLTLPESYTVASGYAAEELADANADDMKRAYHVRAEGVRDVAFVLSEKYHFLTERVENTEVAYYYYRDTAPEQTLKAAVDSLKFYSASFGAYDHPRYTVAETDLAFAGMEYPAFSMISAETGGTERAQVVAHETAHQWWYAKVGSNQFDDAWQDEGLAEYSTALFFEAEPGYGLTYADMVAASERSYRAFFSVYSQVHGEANTVMHRPLTEFSGDYEYRNIAYDKGVILFDRIREVVGSKKLIGALKRYADTCGGTIATPAELINCFSKSGANVSALFDSFLEGKCVI